jgi:hypothetical protein
VEIANKKAREFHAGPAAGQRTSGMGVHEAVKVSPTSGKTTIVIERQPDGKMRATSGAWDGEKVLLNDQAL